MPTLTLTHNGRPIDLIDVRPVGLPASRIVADIRYIGAVLPISVNIEEVMIEYHDSIVAPLEVTA